MYLEIKIHKVAFFHAVIITMILFQWCYFHAIVFTSKNKENIWQSGNNSL
jgi:hypothetical protein